MTTALGLDIGGANLKAADLDGRVASAVFPMWQRHRELTDRLRSLSWIERPDLVGLTMTAELADCFDSKANGVRWVIDSVQQAFPESEVRVWLTTGEFAEPADAIEFPELVAAANWHALATWVGRAVPNGPAVLIDTGSTTTDIIPILDGFPMPSGLKDLERLQCGELVYTGVRRTPLSAVSHSVTLAGIDIPVASESFATIQDVHVVLGSIAEDPENTVTADGKPATVTASRRRIARMLCCDQSELSEENIGHIAQQFAKAQRDQLVNALQRVLTTLQRQLLAAASEEAKADLQVVLSGSGVFLAAEVAAACGLTTTLNLIESSSPAIAEVACAFAIARLVSERCRRDLLQAVSFHNEGI